MADPQQGMRRRYVRWNEQDAVPPIQTSSDADKEARATLTRFSAEPDVLRGLYNRLTGDDAAAEAAYGRALQTQQHAAEQDSNVSTTWRDWGSVGDAAAGVRKVLIGSTPDMALALGSGGIGRGLARRTIGNIERRAAVQQVEQRLANEGIDSLVGRKVAENAARKPAAAASSQVAQAQFQDAIDRTGADLVRRASGAQGRIDAAGRAGFIAGSTAGAFPGIAAQDTQELSQTDREGTLRMLPYQIGQAALEPLVEARLAGRALANPYVKEALQEGVGATRGALSKLPGRIAKETVHNVATEAGTEGMQALLQTAGQRAGRGEDPLAFTGDDLAGALDQAIVGGLAGGAMGGSVEAVNASVPAVVDAAGRTVRAGADAGRWAWDKTGGVRQALRERIRAAAEKRRSPLDAMDGGADPGAQDAPADLGARAGAAAKRAVDTAGTLFDKAKQGLTSAAQRFRGTQDDLTQADELDAQANGAMDWLQANVFDEQGQPPAARHPYTSKATSPLQAWALSKMNPAFLDTLSETEAMQLGQAVEKYAHNGDLTGAEHRLLRDAIAVPDSGLSRDMLNATALVAERITQPKSKAFKDAEGNAPHLARPRGSADDMVALAQDPGGADVVGLDVAASDSQDSAARLTNDWNSGFSEQTATDGIAPIDQLNSLRTSLTAMEARLGKQEARASAEYQALRALGAQLRQQLRDRLENGVVFTRNDASDASRAFWARKTAERWAVPLKDPKDVVLKNGNRTIKQPQVVDLPVVVGRALASINAEGTSEKDIPLDMALARGLSELAMLGYRIDPKQLPLGDMPVAGRTLRVTPAMRRKLAGQFDGRAYGPFPFRPTPVFDDARALDNEYGRDDTEGKYLDEPSSAEALTAREYAQGAREPAPGARAPGGGFVPTLDVVSDVNVKSPHAKTLADWRKARKAATTPAQRRAVNIRFGQQIGADVLAREAQNGQINPRRLEAEMARLTAPDGALALRMLERAARGDFDNVSVRHLPSDKAERVKGDEADPSGLRVRGPQDKREFVRRTKDEAAQREKQEAKLDLPSSRVGTPEPRPIGEYVDPPAPSAENRATANKADARSKAMDKARDAKNVPPVEAAATKPKRRVVLPKTSRYAAKDQAKSDRANKFIGRGAPGSSTAAYAKAWGDRANVGEYSPGDSVFISVNGNRPGALSPPWAEIKKAMSAGATLITDVSADRNRSFNSGERAVAAFLGDNGYFEESPGTWVRERATTGDGVLTPSKTKRRVVKAKDAVQNDELTPQQSAEDVTNELRRMFRGRTAGRSVIVHEGTDAVAALREAGVTDATIANAMFSYSDTQKLPEQTVRDFATLINGKVDANGLPYIQRDTKTSAQVQDIARVLIDHVRRTGNGGLVPEADGAKLSVRGFLRDEDTGEAIDPKDTAEHYRLSDIGRRVAQAMNSGTLASALQHEAKHIHSTREAALAEAADVLYAKVRSGALPTDAARALIAVSKFTAFTVEHADGTRTTTVAEISAANRHIPSLTPDMAKALIMELKTGVGIKQAFRNAAIAEADASAARRAASGKHGWVKYSKGGDHLALNADAANTGWCTGWSDDSVAAQQLSDGDFWIYFDRGDPQIAIRTEDGVVAEVRGRLEGQRLPEKYADIAEAHIESESSLNGARFLQERKKKKALRSFLRSEGAMTVEQAGLLLTTEIAEDGTVKHYVTGDDWNENAVDAARLPPGGLLQADGTWLGNLSLPGRAALPDGVTRVSGDLHAHALTSAPLLERVGGDMYAHALTSAPLLERVGGGMSTYALTSAPRLERVGGDMSAESLTSAPSLARVGRGMSTYALTSAPRLESVGGGMSTYALTSAPRLESVGGAMYAHALTSAPLLERVGGDMSAESLTSAPLLERVGGDMSAESLTSAPRLESVGGRVYAPNLPAEQTALTARQFSHFDEDDDLPFSSRADGAIQGFVYNGAAHLVAGNIPAGDTRGVLLHEIGVHLGSIQSVLGPQRFASAAAAVESWASGSDPMAKTIAEAAARRANGNKEELIAYAVEEAVNRGIAPSAETVVGRWLRAVMAAFHRAVEKLTGSRLKEFSPQDLVDVAYGIAVRGGRQRQNGPAPAQSAIQNDELTPEQSDAIDAGTKSAASDGRHDLKAEQSMLNTILGMLGITEQIGALRTLKDADERGNKGGSYARRSRTVSINPNLHGAERVEVLMHELGHHIIWNEIAKYVEGGFDALQGMTLAESIDVLAKGNPKLYAALRKDFDQWNANGRPSQSPTHRHLRRVVNGVDRVFKDDAQAFHEWFADNIARSLAGKRPVVGVVGKFFAKIATQLRKAWSVISATPSLKPAPSVDAWVKQMLNANVAAVKEATGQAAPQAKAEATVRGAVAAQAAKAGPVKYTMENMGDLVALIETVLPVESRQLLDRVFARPVVLSRLQQIYADNPVVKRMLDHPSQGASARVAFGYLAWQDGLLKTGPQGQNALLGLSDSVLRLFGAAGDGALAQRTLYDIQTGAVQRFRDAGKIYSARDLAARNGNNFQRALNWVNRMVENSSASNALAAFWTGNNARMRESGIPALRTLATMLDRPQGSVGEANPGLITNIRVQTARWNRQMRDALEPLTDRQQLRVLRALQRRAKAGDKAYDALPENARAAVDTIREMFRDAYRYQREAGYTEDDLGHIRDYMPVIMDVRNENARAKLTALYSKPEYARDVAIAAGFVKPDEKGLYDGAEIKAVTGDPKQMAKAVEYLVRAAANDGQTPPPAGAAGRFHFRHQNTQLSAFIYSHGNPDDIKTLASLQTRDPGEVFGRYFAPMVRWSEMARMFGEPEQVQTEDGDPVTDPATGREIWHMNPRAKLDRLLEKVKQQGGTDADAAFADNAVRAALGVYGADGSPTIAAVSPWAAEKLKGRKAQSVIEGVQAYQNARLLPLALLSNLVDPVGIAVRTGGEFNDAWAGFKEGMGFVRAALSKDPQAAKRMLKELEDIDVSEDFLPALAANPVFEGGRTGKARAVNDFVFKWNGVQTWVTATRVMAMYAGHKFLLRHKQQPNDHSARYLQELGLQPADIVEDPNNPGKVEINDKTRAALRQFVDEAILRPNSQQAPLWMSDPYMGIVMQYKMFAYAIWDQIGGRIGREMTQGNMRVVAAALMYLPVIIMAELVREMVQTAGEGDDRRKDWGALEYTKLAADRSGLLGPQYQIMGDIKGDIERSRLPGTSQLGPSLNQGNNALDALQGRRNLGKEFESALPGSPLYRKWNDDLGSNQEEIT